MTARRQVLLGLSAAALAPPAARADAPFKPPSLEANVAAGLEAHVPDGFSLAAAGDMMLTHPVSMRRDAGLQAVFGWLRAADVAVGNFENTLVDTRHFEGYPEATSDSLRPTGDPDVAKDVRAMGFQLVARANNHATDWGAPGMRYTDRLLDEAGVAHAGSGEDLAQAGAPAYLASPSGRIALVSVTSTFEESEPALPPQGLAPGRPGANVLRTRRQVLVDADTLAALKRLDAQQPEGARQPSSSPNVLDLFGVTYVESDKPGVAYVVDQNDLKGILAAIREGKLASDFLVFCVHSHEPGNWSETPADFFPALAHAAIDAGADAVVGAGPHHLRGVEVYKGKPVFYSLGNLFFQFAPQAPVAADMYEKLGVGPGQMTDAELIQSRIGVHVEQPAWYESAIAVTRYRGEAAAEIRLHPITLDLDARMADRGLPRAATGAAAARILQNIARLSAPFGTTLTIEGDVGVIRPAGLAR